MYSFLFPNNISNRHISHQGTSYLNHGGKSYAGGWAAFPLSGSGRAYLTGDQRGCGLLTLVNRSAHLTLPNKQVYDLALPAAITAADDPVTNKSQKEASFP